MSDTAPAIDPTVLDAARRTLREHGWAGTTAERIAAEAGVSRVTLHRKGIKRQHILAALADLAVTAYREAMWPVLLTGGTGAGRITLALETLCNVAEEHLEILIALQAASDAVFHERADDPHAPVATRTPFTEPFERLLRDGAADNTLRPVADPAETATVLFNAAGLTYLHLRTGHNWPPERSRTTTLSLLLDGLRT